MGKGGVCLESKKLKKDSASNVAEAIMSRNSGRRRWIFFSRPRSMSVAILRSWASSTMITLVTHITYHLSSEFHVFQVLDREGKNLG
jgi:hypothetical protein